MWAAASTVMFGFGALAIDISLAHYAKGQTTDLADACTQAASIAYRSSGSEAFASQVAQKVLNNNPILGNKAEINTIQFGMWDNGNFTPNSADGTNAVRITLDHQQDTLLGSIFGIDHTSSSANSTTAWQPVHVVLVTDITNSYTQQDFAYSRAAAVAFYDEFSQAAGPEDMIGMSVFTGQFGVEFTPMQYMDEAATNGVRDDWLALRTASKDGPYTPGASSCSGTSDNRYFPQNCFPNMPREYRDESGTDHAIGLKMAGHMLDEVDESGVFNAAIIMTDGNPNGTGPHQQRAAAGFVETRWRYMQAGRGLLAAGSPPAPGTQYSQSEVISNSQSEAYNMYQNNQVNIWAISFVANANWMSDVAQGRGYYVRTNDVDEIVPIYIDIARSLPMVVVQ